MKKILILALFCLLIAGCSQGMEYQQTRMLMDTAVTITLYADNDMQAKEAFAEAFSEIERIEEKFSIYKNSTTAYELNENKSVIAEKEFISLVKQASEYSELTNGSFDITVQPMLDLYSESFQNNNRPPTSEEINATLKHINYSEVDIMNDTVSIDGEMKITFGAIVKGYAIDKAIATLKENNIDSALVNAGGDMFGYGLKQNGNAWKIAVKNPEGSGYLMNMPLKNQAVATSGNYERYFNENKSFHHIVNPNTGYSANECISVTVVAQNATKADALATGLFVMGPEGMKIIEELGAEAMMITADKKIHYSSDFQY